MPGIGTGGFAGPGDGTPPQPARPAPGGGFLLATVNTTSAVGRAALRGLARLALPFRLRHHRFQLVPEHQIDALAGSKYRATGTDPQFSVHSSRRQLPRRWAIVSYSVDDPAGILAPQLYYDRGQGYSDAASTHLPAVSTPPGGILIHIPYNVRRMRLNPGYRAGSFEIEDFQCIELGVLPLLAVLSARQFARTGFSPSAWLLLLGRGLRRAMRAGLFRAVKDLIESERLRFVHVFDPPYEILAPRAGPTEDAWQEMLAGRRTPRKGPPLVDVIVPVYRGHDATLSAIYHVLESSVVVPHEVIVVDDASPEPALSAALTVLAGRGTITLIRNESNRGFAHSVNQAMALHPERDVLLLNSDTEVYGNWLDRLRRAAYREPRIGTVTPLTNNGEICSYPDFAKPNPMRLECSGAELDALTAQVHAGASAQIPTAVGFCMYIRRDCLREVGTFDEELFGGGYGEENYFCLQATAKQWKHVLAADVFVTHFGGVSFGSAKSGRMREALRVLQRTFPDYSNTIRAFVKDDPLRPFRRRLDWARLGRSPASRKFLFVLHNWRGGIEQHVQDLCRLLKAANVEPYFLRPHPRDNRVAGLSREGIRWTPSGSTFRVDESPDLLAEALSAIGITHAHVHSLAGFCPEFSPWLPRAFAGAKVRFDFTVHDYMAVCPRIHLVDSSGFYCGVPAAEVCNRCVKKLGSSAGSDVDVGKWRHHWREFLGAARMVFVPNPDVRQRLIPHFPGVTFDLRPHPEAPPPRWERRAPRKKLQGESVRVAVIGAIGPHKGSQVLRRCVHDAADRRLGLHFVLIGTSDIRLEASGYVTVLGEYDQERIYDIIQSQACDLAFFPAVSPETYSFTLSVALNAGMFPVAFDLGAIADRIRGSNTGALLPFSWVRSPSLVNDRLLELGLSLPEFTQPESHPAASTPDPEDFLREYYDLGDVSVATAQPVSRQKP